MLVAPLLGLPAPTLLVARVGAGSVVALLLRPGCLLVLMIPLRGLPLLPAAAGPTMRLERMRGDAEEMAAWIRRDLGKQKIFLGTFLGELPGT